jgi:ubiquinone/menaquinone biosynthesis C-methylase UbiE
MKPHSFDRIARPYRWLEYLSFGPLLEHCRFQYLGNLRDCRHALVLGDGDGRFAARLLAANPHITVEAVDSSGSMLRLLTGRVRRLGPDAMARLHTRQTNALALVPEAESYDLVVTHFFLDCFSDAEFAEIVRNIRPRLAANALWLVSEFAIPQQSLAAAISRFAVSSLYRIFGLLTGLKVRTLPDYPALLSEAGFVLQFRQPRLAGLLASELWRLDSRSNATAPARPHS